MLLKTKIFIIAILMAAMTSQWVNAATVVFVQGYQSSGMEWRRQGIMPLLVESGWRDGGHIIHGRNGIETIPPFVGVAKKGTLYTVALPTEAPLMVQSDILEHYLINVKARHLNERLFLVGHSAGGVLARLYMVTHPDQKIAGLITIAAPHLGTEASEIGLAVAQSPASMMLPFIGAGNINRSQGLFYDLSREHTGNLLFWLNRQPHPQSQYISIIRGDGDIFVSPMSQDMNRVVALEGRAKTFFAPGDHSLEYTDAPIILKLLNAM